MSVKIRLQRCGKPKKPFYRIVVIDSRRQRDSQPIEQLGHYDPLKEGTVCAYNEQRLDYWVKCGAQVSARVTSMLKNAKQVKAGKEGE